MLQNLYFYKWLGHIFYFLHEFFTVSLFVGSTQLLVGFILISDRLHLKLDEV